MARIQAHVVLIFPLNTKPFRDFQMFQAAGRHLARRFDSSLVFSYPTIVGKQIDSWLITTPLKKKALHET